MRQKEGAPVPTALVAVADATVYYDKPYTYTVPARLDGHIFAGSLVLVPFGAGGARPRTGVVLRLERQAEPNARLKEILDAAPAEEGIDGELMDIVRYLREVTLCTWFEAVRAVIPYGAQYRAVRGQQGWALRAGIVRGAETVYEAREAENAVKLTEKQSDVLACAKDAPRTRARLMRECGVSAAVVAALVKKNLLRAVRREMCEEPPPLRGDEPAREADFVLSPEQREVARRLEAEMAKPRPAPALLHGVTGSGKTPVFLHLVRAALDAGKTALVLVPEIGLTPQMRQRLCTAFGRDVAVQHSGMSPTERLRQWRAIRRGGARVVVGTRSAVFAPLRDIGLIVVDEEQERSYQSESSPRYDAVDIARRRAARHGALLLLASATPSVAAFYAAERGRMSLHRLPRRYGNLPLPRVECVDMRGELEAGNAGALSGRLAVAVQDTVSAGGQAIMLLNRRGYHRVAVCRACGAAVKCGGCSVPMVFHRDAAAGHTAQGGEPRERGRLVCHYCGSTHSPAPEACPECGGELRYAGFGTQKLEEELAARLPQARLLRMDLDTTRRRDAHAAMLRRFAGGEYDVLLGTQMVAKGLDFERVRLVGVVGIDSLLYGQGYRVFETVFSLVTQVVGRAGRSGAQGAALIQTVDPQNPVLRMAAGQDYDAFYREEIAFRRLAMYPPFCTLCTVSFAAKEEADALYCARRFAALLVARAQAGPRMPLRVLGPAPMQVVQVAGSFRYRLTLKCRADNAFRAMLRGAVEDYGGEGLPKKAAVGFDFHGDG